MKKRKNYSKKLKEECLTCIQIERDIGIGHGAVMYAR